MIMDNRVTTRSGTTRRPLGRAARRFRKSLFRFDNPRVSRMRGDACAKRVADARHEIGGTWIPCVRRGHISGDLPVPKFNGRVWANSVGKRGGRRSARVCMARTRLRAVNVAEAEHRRERAAIRHGQGEIANGHAHRRRGGGQTMAAAIVHRAGRLGGSVVAHDIDAAVGAAHDRRPIDKHRNGERLERDRLRGNHQRGNNGETVHPRRRAEPRERETHASGARIRIRGIALGFRVAESRHGSRQQLTTTSFKHFAHAHIRFSWNKAARLSLAKIKR